MWVQTQLRDYIVTLKTIPNYLSPWGVIGYLLFWQTLQEALKKKWYDFVLAFPSRKDILCIYLGSGMLGDTLEGEFPMWGGNQLFIPWHGGLSTTLTAAEVALRLRTSRDGYVSHIYSVSPCKPKSFWVALHCQRLQQHMLKSSPAVLQAKCFSIMRFKWCIQHVQAF